MSRPPPRLRELIARAAKAPLTNPQACLTMLSASTLGCSPLAQAFDSDRSFARRLGACCASCDHEELAMVARGVAATQAAPSSVVARLGLAALSLPSSGKLEAVVHSLRAARGNVAGADGYFAALEGSVCSNPFTKVSLSLVLAAAEALCWRPNIHSRVDGDASAWPTPIAMLARRAHRIKSPDDAARAIVYVRWSGVSTLSGRALTDHASLPEGTMLLLFGATDGGAAPRQRLLSKQAATEAEALLLAEIAVALAAKHPDSECAKAACDVMSGALSRFGPTPELLRASLRLLWSTPEGERAELQAAIEAAAGGLAGAPVLPLRDVPVRVLEAAESALESDEMWTDGFASLSPEVAMALPSVATYAASKTQDAAVPFARKSLERRCPTSRHVASAVLRCSLRRQLSASGDFDVATAWRDAALASADSELAPDLVKLLCSKTTAADVEVDDVRSAIDLLRPPARWLPAMRAAEQNEGASPGSEVVDAGENPAAALANFMSASGGALEHEQIQAAAAAARAFTSQPLADVPSIERAAAAVTLLALSRSLATEAAQAASVLAQTLASAPDVRSHRTALTWLVTATRLLGEPKAQRPEFALDGGSRPDLRGAIAAIEALLREHPSDVTVVAAALLPGACHAEVVKACATALGECNEHVAPLDYLRTASLLRALLDARGPSAAGVSLEGPGELPAALGPAAHAAAAAAVDALDSRAALLVDQLLPTFASSASLADVATVAAAAGSLRRAPSNETVARLERAAVRACSDAPEGSNVEAAAALLTALRKLYVPRGEAHERLESLIKAPDSPSEAAAMLGTLGGDSPVAIVDTALAVATEAALEASPRELAALCQAGVSARTACPSAEEQLRTLAERALASAASQLRDGRRLLVPDAVAILELCCACGGKPAEADATQVVEWISGDVAPLLPPAGLVAVTRFMAAAGIRDADYAHAIGAQLALASPSMTPREMSDGVFYLAQAGGFNSVHLQRLGDTVVDRAGEFRSGRHIVRLLHGFTKMGVMHRGSYNVFAARLRLRPVLYSASVRDAVVALDAFAGAKYLDDAVFQALLRRIEVGLDGCSPIDVALAAQGLADLYIDNAPFYNSLADRAIGLAGALPAPEGDAEQPEEEENAAAYGERAAEFPPAAGVRLLEALGAAGIKRHDAAEAVIARITTDHGPSLTGPVTLRLVGALCDMGYAGDALDGLAEVLVQRVEELTSADLKELCCMLLMMNWRDAPLLQAIADHAVRLHAQDELEPVAARLTLDALSHFLCYHSLARAQLSDTARSVSREVLPDDQEPAAAIGGASKTATLSA